MQATELPMPWDHVRVERAHIGHERNALAVDPAIDAGGGRTVPVDGAVVEVGGEMVVNQ